MQPSACSYMSRTPNKIGTVATVPTYSFSKMFLTQTKKAPCYEAFSFFCFMQVTALMTATIRQNAEIDANTTDQPNFSLMKP